MRQTQKLRDKKETLKVSSWKTLALRTKFTERQKENDNEGMGGQESDFGKQICFLGCGNGIPKKKKKSGRNGISLINQFCYIVKKK